MIFKLKYSLALILTFCVFSNLYSQDITDHLHLILRQPKNGSVIGQNRLTCLIHFGQYNDKNTVKRIHERNKRRWAKYDIVWYFFVDNFQAFIKNYDNNFHSWNFNAGILVNPSGKKKLMFAFGKEWEQIIKEYKVSFKKILAETSYNSNNLVKAQRIFKGKFFRERFDRAGLFVKYCNEYNESFNNKLLANDNYWKEKFSNSNSKFYYPDRINLIKLKTGSYDELFCQCINHIQKKYNRNSYNPKAYLFFEFFLQKRLDDNGKKLFETATDYCEDLFEIHNYEIPFKAGFIKNYLTAQNKNEEIDTLFIISGLDASLSAYKNTNQTINKDLNIYSRLKTLNEKKSFVRQKFDYRYAKLVSNVITAFYILGGIVLLLLLPSIIQYLHKKYMLFINGSNFEKRRLDKLAVLWKNGKQKKIFNLLQVFIKRYK